MPVAESNANWTTGSLVRTAGAESRPSRPRLLEPGLLPFVPGVERYRTSGGGASVISLLPGDEIEFIDHEGRQSCELSVVHPSGDEDFEALGLKAERRSSAIAALVAAGDKEVHELSALLAMLDLDPDSLHACEVLSASSRPGETVALVAERAAVCIVVVPGAPMKVFEHSPPTEIAIRVKRSAVEPGLPISLPPLLADPRLDFRIGRATASTYAVRAGDYIQVIDVGGRQCTDFLAFHRADLDRGVERGLGRHHHSLVDGCDLSESGAWPPSSSIRTCDPSSKWCVTRSVATTPSCWHVAPSITRTWAIPDMPTVRTISIPHWSRTKLSGARAGRQSTSSITPAWSPAI